MSKESNLNKFILVAKAFRGHKGRPGQRGGSLPRSLVVPAGYPKGRKWISTTSYDFDAMDARNKFLQKRWKEFTSQHRYTKEQGIADSLRGARAALKDFPEHLTRGVNLEFNQSRGKGWYDRLSKTINVGFEYEDRPIGLYGVGTTQDMGQIGGKYWDTYYLMSGQNTPYYGAVTRSDNPDMEIAKNTAHHEMGHHIWWGMSPEKQIEAERIFGSKDGLKVQTGGTGAYREHYADREFSGMSIPAHLRSRRMASEVFAEAIRLKVEKPKVYKALPKRLTSFIDALWKK